MISYEHNFKLQFQQMKILGTKDFLANCHVNIKTGGAD